MPCTQEVVEDFLSNLDGGPSATLFFRSHSEDSGNDLGSHFPRYKGLLHQAGHLRTLRPSGITWKQPPGQELKTAAGTAAGIRPDQQDPPC